MSADATRPPRAVTVVVIRSTAARTSSVCIAAWAEMASCCPTGCRTPSRRRRRRPPGVAPRTPPRRPRRSRRRRARGGRWRVHRRRGGRRCRVVVVAAGGAAGQSRGSPRRPDRRQPSRRRAVDVVCGSPWECDVPRVDGGSRASMSTMPAYERDILDEFADGPGAAPLPRGRRGARHGRRGPRQRLLRRRREVVVRGRHAPRPRQPPTALRRGSRAASCSRAGP